MGPLAKYCTECGTRLPAPENPPSMEEQIKFDMEICEKSIHQRMKYLTGATHCPVCGKYLTS